MNPVLLPWLIEAGIITVQDLTQNKTLPLPSRFLASFVVFGALSGLAGSAALRNAATYAAWGLVLATAIPTVVTGTTTTLDRNGNVVNVQSNEVKKGGYFDFLTSVGDFMAGKSNAATQNTGGTNG